MGKHLWVLGLMLVFSTNVKAADSAFCESAQSQDFFRDRALDPNMRISWQNPADGALGLKTGMCWWHSRFQRSLVYLAHARPLKNGEKPMSTSEIKKAISQLISESKVVELRGYSSIFDFTQKNQKTIHTKFKWWQAFEALNSVKGLQGKPVVPAEEMQNLITGLYDFVENKKFIAYEMLQYPGVTAHAWLVTHVTPIYDRLVNVGYELSIIDSNYPVITNKFTYRYGQTHFDGDFGDFTPYLQWASSLKRFYSAIFHYCKPNAARTLLISNLESVGNKIVMKKLRSNITGLDLARDLRSSIKHTIPSDIAKKYTFSERQFDELNWRELSSAPETNSTVARLEE